MLFTLRAVRDNIRNRDGKRVFYLAQGDRLTSEARDYLLQQRIEILPAQQARPERYRLLGGGYMEEKPEHMTHLYGDVLVEKTHPRIAFRGQVDALEAELLLLQQAVPSLRRQLQELLELARMLLRCEVMQEPVPQMQLCGMDAPTLRAHSHFPQQYYGQPHFMPSAEDPPALLQLNHLRCSLRGVERTAVAALPDRQDILQALNRMSSCVYILMIRIKAEAEGVYHETENHITG